MKAIETEYRGYRFRSRLEARWAVFFSALSVEWEYEKEGYELGEHGRYLPDFWLPRYDVWFEVKGAPCSLDDRAKIEALQVALNKQVILAEGNIPESVYESYISGVEVIRPLPNPDLIVTREMIDISDDSYNSFGASVCCPICGDSCVHLKSAALIPGEDSWKAWAGRGDAVKIRMNCESGHAWTLRYGFHKGNTYVAIEDVTSMSSDFLLILADFNEERADRALLAARSARSARFEYGETPL